MCREWGAPPETVILRFLDEEGMRLEGAGAPLPCEMPLPLAVDDKDGESSAISSSFTRTLSHIVRGYGSKKIIETHTRCRRRDLSASCLQTESEGVNCCCSGREQGHVY